MSDKRTIAIIGGTGDLGSGLAKCWASAGHKIIVGSRSKEKAAAVCSQIGPNATAADYVEATRSSSLVVLAVPYSMHAIVLEDLKHELKGKILIDAVVPLVPPKVSVVQLPSTGSAALSAQAILGETVRVVAAFHNVGAAKLQAGNRVDCDVLVFGNDRDAKSIVIDLAGEIGNRGIDGGGLANSAAAEALTSVLISINRTYKVAGAGIRITGLA
ncbi:NADPH-dependent F420 reductase [Bradyrhizobium canariense]|uniref:Reduced coenzyme F420:NADP oxidoreductase n=1 Tax=Bradyrhizobium canariense TaxID=255045 RepID=A0A1H1YR83_9BRAD|nr:NADPH-dependent F420 reductase [Bradyrhizobium canariense]SDT23917.1 reduced coenzyme F420:NADP oxidoreductase [Bradyrhizobium canariense]